MLQGAAHRPAPDTEMPSPLPEVLGPSPFAPAFRSASSAPSTAAWTALCDEVGPRVWSFPLFTPEACGRLLDEIDRRAAARRPDERSGRPPNSMHAYGVVLEELGLGAFLKELRALLAPLASLHFADTGGGDLDGEHGFLAEYGPDADDALGYHVDDSAVTLNLCLGGSFSGSELYFRGLRCDGHRQTGTRRGEAFELEHEVGTAILHAGRHRHGVHPIRRGRRRNLILWMQSSAAKRAAASCQRWCGVHAPAQ